MDHAAELGGELGESVGLDGLVVEVDLRGVSAGDVKEGDVGNRQRMGLGPVYGVAFPSWCCRKVRLLFDSVIKRERERVQAQTI